MKALTYSKILLAGASIAAVSVVAGMTACSSSSSSSNGTGPTGGNDAGNTAPQSCTNMALNILFTPMYSASDGTHTFQIPAVVDGVDNTQITWSVSDTSIATIAKDDTFVTGGALITAINANGGTVTVTAALSGGTCGTSTLNVTAATTDDWQIGNSRYNDGVSIHFGPPGGRGGDGGPPGDAGPTTDTDGGGPACTNCHGPTATNGAFNDISHTPAQTGGFSDEDLVNIIVNGVVPDGGYFDPSIISYERWQQFHKWSDIGTDQQKGIVVYLRSLTPAPQAGSANFGGHFGDGGPPHFGDGGFGPPPAEDAATGD